MLNKELFVLNPDENNLKNNGVVDMNTSPTEEKGQQIVYHEIKTFVCEGEYERGLYRILDTYLRNFNEPKQPAVWVSGFFGSGKSHLVKLLSYLWEDFRFSNGETARKIKQLPHDVNDKLVELSRKQELYGSVVVRGLLSDFPAKDLRYSFLQLLLKSLALPTKLHQFRFWNWCRTEGILELLISRLESKGKSLDSELNQLYMSREISNAILELIPGFAETEAQVRDQIARNFPIVTSISRDEFLFTVKSQVLPLVSPKMPCILVALDEIQQFIGSDEDRATQLTQLAELLCENFEGRLLLVCTGQNALTDTPLLQRLNDRFTVKVPLTDKDVETVTRKTVLEKKPSVVGALNQKIEASIGEISRLLDGTDFGFTQADKQTLIADYPILPSTQKFWKRILQAIDVAGTSGQLRSQLRIVDETVKTVAQKPLGEVIPGDFVFEQKKSQLIQNALLLNEQSNLIEELKTQGDAGLLKARILSITFLIDLLPKDSPKFRLKSDKKTIADLLLHTLNEPADGFRNKVGTLVDELANTDKYLVQVDDEFKLQTRIGSEWEQEFSKQAAKARGDDARVYEFRRKKIQNFLTEKLRAVYHLQGKSKMRRDLSLYSGDSKPQVSDKLNLWVRDGWLENEATLLEEIRAAGMDEPLAYIYIQRTKDQELKREIIKYLAAEDTLNEKGLPSTPEGEQARRSMDTRKKMAGNQVNEIIESICSDAKIYLAGGSMMDSGDLAANVKTALDAIAARQFPEFGKADYSDWVKAFRKVQNNDTQALKAIGFNNDPKDHPMAAEVLVFIGNAGKTGREVRTHFGITPYGWSQDAIDTMLLALKLSGNLSTKESELNQRTLAQAVFKLESITLTLIQKVEIRKLFQVAGVHCQSGAELSCSMNFLRTLDDLAESVYGDAPRPEFVKKELITEIMNLDGNERLMAIFENADRLRQDYEHWKKDAETINKRMPEWDLLVGLNRFAANNEETNPIKAEIAAIRTERLLLLEPDPVQSPLARLSDYLRKTLNALKDQHNRIYDEKMAALQANEYFKKLSPDQQQDILSNNQILSKPGIKSYNADELLAELNNISLEAWADKVAALPSKFHQALDDAIKLSAPKAVSFTLPRRTIRSDAELDAYLGELKNSIREMLNDGDVILK